MKNILIVVLLFVSQFCFSQGKSFVLNGKITGKQTGKIYLITWNDEWYRIKDSSNIINGNFKFTGQLSGYTNYAYLKLNPDISENSDTINGVQIGLENANMLITLKLNQFSKYKLTGCKACDEYQNFKNAKPKISIEKYVISRPNSSISARLIFDNYRYDGDLSLARELFYKLSKTQQKSYYGNQVSLKIQEGSLIGSRAKNFTKPDLEGNTVSLFKLLENNIVLLEFWGSWCNPCRAEHPKLIELYKKYHSKGFEIIGIADDDNNEEKWKKAIANDSVGIWPQILMGKKIVDNKNTASQVDIGNLYFVRQFPTLYLIDKSKKVVGQFEMDELEKQLIKTFGF